MAITFINLYISHGQSLFQKKFSYVSIDILGIQLGLTVANYNYLDRNCPQLKKYAGRVWYSSPRG